MSHAPARVGAKPARPPVADSHLKDIDFSERSICKRWELGYEHTKNAIEETPWRAEPVAHECVIVHNSGPA
jgi:hypothetical protein